MKNAAKIQKALIPMAIINVIFYLSAGLGDTLATVCIAVCYASMFGLCIWSGAIRYVPRWLFMPFYHFNLIGAIILFIAWWGIAAPILFFLPVGYMLYARYQVMRGA